MCVCVPTLIYLSTLLPCILRHFQYCGTSFCMPSSKKDRRQAFQHLLYLLVTPQTLASHKNIA